MLLMPPPDFLLLLPMLFSLPGGRPLFLGMGVSATAAAMAAALVSSFLPESTPEELIATSLWALLADRRPEDLVAEPVEEGPPVDDDGGRAGERERRVDILPLLDDVAVADELVSVVTIVVLLVLEVNNSWVDNDDGLDDDDDGVELLTFAVDRRPLPRVRIDPEDESRSPTSASSESFIVGVKFASHSCFVTLYRTVSTLDQGSIVGRKWILEHSLKETTLVRWFVFLCASVEEWRTQNEWLVRCTHTSETSVSRALPQVFSSTLEHIRSRTQTISRVWFRV